MSFINDNKIVTHKNKKNTKTDNQLMRVPMRMHLFFKITFFLMPSFGIGYVTANHISPEEQIYFKKIGISDGLSQATVNCFLEDHHGFIWIGTDDGLNRFDGVNFKIYRSGKAEKGGLSNSTVVHILEQPKGVLWVCTTYGLNKLSIMTGEIVHYTDSSINNHFSSVLYDTLNNILWIAANEGGVKYLDIAEDEIKSIDDPTLNFGVVRYLLLLDEENLLIGTLSRGIYKLNTKSKTVEPFLNDDALHGNLPRNKIRKIIRSGDKLVFGIEGAGVFFYNLKTHTSRIISQQNSNLSTNQIYTLGKDASGNILVGTDQGGLNIIDKKNMSVKVYKHDEFDFRSISSDVIRSIFTDSQSNIWIGTYYGGINYINKQSRGIYYYGKHPLKPNSLSNNHVTAFELADDGGMWVGTDGGGLNHFKNGKFWTITKGASIKDLNDNVIMCLKKSGDGKLYIGTFRGGLNVLENGRVEKYTSSSNDPSAISDNAVWAIQIDKEGNVWLGTNNGLNKFDPETKKFTVFKPILDDTYQNSRNNTRSLLIDSKGNLWVGTFGGLGKFNIEDEKYEYFINTRDDGSGLGNDIIVKILEGHDNKLWLGTYGGGLNKFDPETGSLKVYDDKNGLPSNIIQSIELDSHKFLWVSTMKGLARFDPDNETTQILDESYGLQGTVFKHNSSFQTDDGYMYFGGIRGFNIFHPDSITFPIVSGNIIFTDFQIFDHPLKQGIMNLNHAGEKKISISYRDSRYFTVYFSIPNYVIAKKINFAYQLAGFEDTWHYIGNERKITFTGLGPGDYELRIKVSSNNIWSDSYDKLSISIVPPFYRRADFIAFCVLLVIVLTVSFNVYRTRRFKSRQVELEKLVEAKNREIKIQNDELKRQNMELVKTHGLLREANESLEEEVKKRTRKLKVAVNKLNKTVKELDRFVYSASHDLSAPLKSIKGLVNIAKLENRDDNLELHLQYIEGSILKLEGVIGDLIQFSRNSRLSIIMTELPLLNFVKDVLDTFKYMPEYEQLDITINIPDDVNVRSDKQRLQMILYNLIGNAIKYQDTNKKRHWIRIEYKKLENGWSVEVSDNGIGIPDSHQSKIFSMFYRATEKSTGTGLGLFIVKEAVEKLSGTISLSSKEGEGSSFIVEFRV